MHDTCHSIGVVLKENVRAVACFSTLGERELLELCRYGLFRVVATVVHDIRIGVYHQTYILRGLELVLQTDQELLSCLEIILTRNDIESDILDRTVRGLLVLLFVLFVQRLDVTLAHFDETVCYRVVRLHHILSAHTVLTTVESKLSIQ